MLVDHILYTATDEDTKHGLHGGYAVAAKSEGITDNLLEFLDQYHYPLGINDHDIFNRIMYRSLTKHKSKLIYTVAHTGIGHDGRDGTFNTQHFVFDAEKFEQLQNDTTHINPFVSPLSHTTRSLSLFRIPRVYDSSVHVMDLPRVKEIVQYIIDKRKVAILYDKSIINIPGILQCVPPASRIVPWSNVVYDQSRQTNFKLIAGNHNMKYSLGSGWKIFDLNKEDKT